MVAVKSEPEAAVGPSTSNSVFTTDIATMTCSMHDGGAETARQPLHAGPDGLMIAKFGELVHTTELSNLMLQFASGCSSSSPAVKKRPAAKRPAAAAKTAAKPAEAVAKTGPAKGSAVKQQYSYMWYSLHRCVGIRQKLPPKRQVFSFGGRKCTI